MSVSPSLKKARAEFLELGLLLSNYTEEQSPRHLNLGGRVQSICRHCIGVPGRERGPALAILGCLEDMIRDEKPFIQIRNYSRTFTSLGRNSLDEVTRAKTEVAAERIWCSIL